MRSTYILACVLLMASCRENRNEEESGQRPEVTDKMLREQLIRVNRQLLQKENDEMDYYEKSHKMPFVRTPSGIRYYVYKPSASGDSIRESMRIDLDFEIRLLDGTLCYTSKTEGRRTVTIGHDDVESGIHRGLQYLKRGDKALLMLPSSLAHGLLGDFKKIPPQMPIVCDIVTY
jgi:FKBP-type peptidyl-prolyl cis-trans isomerase FkpA